jgi:hypothetical protein
MVLAEKILGCYWKPCNTRPGMVLDMSLHTTVHSSIPLPKAAGFVSGFVVDA